MPLKEHFSSSWGKAWALRRNPSIGHFPKCHFLVDFKQVLCTSWLFCFLMYSVEGGPYRILTLMAYGVPPYQVLCVLPLPPSHTCPSAPLHAGIWSAVGGAHSHLRALAFGIPSTWKLLKKPCFLTSFRPLSAKMSVHGGRPCSLCLVCNTALPVSAPLLCPVFPQALNH